MNPTGPGRPASQHPRRHWGCAARWHARAPAGRFLQSSRAERANIAATTESSRTERANIAATTETARAERANITATTETAGLSEPKRKQWGQGVAYVRDPFGTLVEPASPTD
ncbi:MAG: Glyoxalase-like domain [Thermoleophilaceae bacterium]|nr:Glyoxalase-like domain [Thermoleophilaceae bacterium]